MNNGIFQHPFSFWYTCGLCSSCRVRKPPESSLGTPAVIPRIPRLGLKPSLTRQSTEVTS